MSLTTKFLIFLQCLYFIDSKNKLFKIVHQLNNRFRLLLKQNFHSFQNIYIDKTLLLFKNRLLFKQIFSFKCNSI